MNERWYTAIMAERVIMCSTIYRDAEKVPVPAEELTFRPSVYGVLIDGEKVLLHGYMDGYDFPGGGLNKGEGLKEGLQREFFEETGVTIDVGKLLYVTQDFFIHPATQKAYHTVLLYYACSNPRGTITTDNFDEHEKAVARAAEWQPLSAIQGLRFFNPLSREEIGELIEMAKSDKGI